MPAPTSKATSSGSGSTLSTVGTTTSCQPPTPVSTATRWPGASPEPSGALRTTPATSPPGAKGGSGRSWY